MSAQRRTLLETTTPLRGAQVLAAATEFFARRNSLYAAFPEQVGESYATFRGQGGEEIAIAVHEIEGLTRVTGSSYMFDAQVQRFFATLPAGAAA